MTMNNKPRSSQNNDLKPAGLLKYLITATRAATLEQVHDSLALMASTAKHTEPGAVITHAMLDGFLAGLCEQTDKLKQEMAQDEHK